MFILKKKQYFQHQKLTLMAGSISQTNSDRISDTGIPTNYGALGTLVTVFFFWGFIAAGNSVFIPFCKHKFQLDQFQSQLVDFAFYLAYYIGALSLFAYGAFGGKDIVAKWGYKRSIVYGLLFSAMGAVVMIIAVYGNTFVGMLGGLFIVALGFSLQQTAANPFAIALGDPSSGSSRVNLGGGINSFGTMVGPIIVAIALFGSTAPINDEMIASLGLTKVIILYCCVGFLFIAAAALFYFSKKVPDGINSEKTERADKALYRLIIMTGLLVIMFVPVFNTYKSDEQKIIVEKQAQLDILKKANPTSTTAAYMMNEQEIVVAKEINDIKHPLERKRMYWLFGALAVVVLGLLFSNFQAQKKAEGWGAMAYPQLVLGMLAIFTYVGVEVGIVSNLSELLSTREFGGISSSEAAPYISVYWGGLMIGRWMGSISAFDFKESTKRILTFVVPLVAFGILLGVNFLSNYDVTPFYFFIVCVFIQIIAFYISKDRPAVTLQIFASLGAIAMLIGIFATGKIATYAILSGGLFCSIMWPAIFTLAITGLGKYTTQGAAFLVMMILGGGIIPPIQGKLSDLLQANSDVPGFGIQNSYWIPVLCFVYLIIFAVIVKNILARQGIVKELVVTDDAPQL